jgi:xanthine dehydrogenase accessory factor
VADRNGHPSIVVSEEYMREELVLARQWIQAGERVALARVTAVEGSAPRPVGAAMVISSASRFAGSVSGGCVEGEVIQTAERVIADSQAITLHFSGDADPLTEIVLGCGGNATIFVERLDRAGDLSPVFAAFLDTLHLDDGGTLLTRCTTIPSHWLLAEDGTLLARDTAAAPDPAAFAHTFAAPVRLIIVGADAVGQAVAHQAHALRWPVTVIDPRGAWLTPQRFPDASARHVRWPDEALPEIALDERTAIVVLTHDPKIDEPALVVALRSQAGYVGALGSRRASADRTQRLLAAGLSEAQLARLHSPIGLNLGGRTPAEMALSIVAEIVAERNGRPGGMLRSATGPIHELAAERVAP